MTQEWLVQLTVTVPAGVSPEEVDRRRQEEAARAAELQQQGALVRLWRVPGRWANWGLWSARDATELDGFLASLPLFDWATIAVHPLAIHPSDPVHGETSAS